MEHPEIVILGHTGFIGNTIFEQFASQNIIAQGISSKEVDLRKLESRDYLSNTLTASSILIFSAALIRQRGDNLETLQDNIKLASNVASVIENQPIKKCVYLSTADVYDQPVPLPITEETSVNPQTYYAAAKYCSESLLKTACQRSNVPILIFRYAGIFGPGQKEGRYGPNSFVETAIKDRVIKLWGDGKELRDMVYVRDLARIITQLVESDAQGIFNIATGKSVTFLEVAEALRQLLPSPVEIIHQERTGPKFDQGFNVDKLKQTLPNLEFTPLRKALKEMHNLALAIE